jgi:hypothetical protein
MAIKSDFLMNEKGWSLGDNCRCKTGTAYPSADIAWDPPGLLLGARMTALRHFPEANVAIDEEEDPETGESQFVITIHTDLPVDQARQKLRQLGNEWFADERRASASPCILFTTWF